MTKPFSQLDSAEIQEKKGSRKATYHREEHRDEVTESDGARGVDHPHVDEDVGQIENDEGTEEAEAKPGSADVHWKQKGALV